MPEYNWITESIFTVTDFFSPAECQACIERGEAAGFDTATINTIFGPEVWKEVRSNTRVIIDDTAWAEALWQRARDYVPSVLRNWRAVGVNERFRLYRYDVGQLFDWHLDGAFTRDDGDRSQLTFMIYLNGDFAGGQTVFDRLEIVPKPGLALFFEHELLHKGATVTQGRKYVLRTDVMYRRGAR